MTLRNLEAGMALDTVDQIDQLLGEISREHGVYIPWAIESGSRAWGFPSPDSDYDARFIYVRPADQALTVWPRRDVIELPIVDDLDVNGWDLAKALRLILKGNAVVVEWLNSPIIYQGDAKFRDELLAFAQTWIDRDRLASHYLYLARRHRETDLAPSGPVKLKKLFYALRPAAVVSWMRLHPERSFPRIRFSELMSECGAPSEVRELSEELVERKLVTRELGMAVPPPALLTYVDQCIAGGDIFRARTRPQKPGAAEAADTLFGDITRRLDAAREGS